MTVWIVRREYNLPDADEADDNPVLGVYATEAEAQARHDREVADARREGYLVAGQPVRDENEEDWYVEFHVDRWDVPAAPHVVGTEAPTPENDPVGRFSPKVQAEVIVVTVAGPDRVQAIVDMIASAQYDKLDVTIEYTPL